MRNQGPQFALICWVYWLLVLACVTDAQIVNQSTIFKALLRPEVSDAEPDVGNCLSWQVGWELHAALFAQTTASHERGLKQLALSPDFHGLF